MRRISPFFVLFLMLALMSASPALVYAVGEVSIQNLKLEPNPPDRYLITGDVSNLSRESREVTLRAQASFYEEGSPAGDIPAMTLRKDITIVLKPGEKRKVQVHLLNEGSFPRGDLRIEPVLRIRRQRPWSY